jgi:hypothetical protein
MTDQEELDNMIRGTINRSVNAGAELMRNQVISALQRERIRCEYVEPGYLPVVDAMIEQVRQIKV